MGWCANLHNAHRTGAAFHNFQIVELYVRLTLPHNSANTSKNSLPHLPHSCANSRPRTHIYTEYAAALRMATRQNFQEHTFFFSPISAGRHEEIPVLRGSPARSCDTQRRSIRAARRRLWITFPQSRQSPLFACNYPSGGV